MFAVSEASIIDRFTLVLDSGFAKQMGQWVLTAGDPTDPAPALKPAQAKPGDTISLSGADQVRMGVTVKQVLDPAPGTRFSKPTNGARFVGVQFDLSNSGSVLYQDSPTNGIELIDSLGQTYSPRIAETDAGPALGSGVMIPPNETRSGWVIFEIPETSTPAKVQVALNSGFADQVGEWQIL